MKTRRTPGRAAAALGADGCDARVGVRAPEKRGVQHAGQLHVVEEAALPAQEARVLAPWHGRAEVLGSHCAISLRDAL